MAGISDKVWAKSDSQSLIEHVEDCLVIFSQLKQALPQLPHIAGLSNFWELLFFAVYLHDIGKCHREFQNYIRDKENLWCNQRHEIYSVPFVDKLSLNQAEISLIKRVILSHHKTFDVLINKYKTPEELQTELDLFWRNQKIFRKKFSSKKQIFHPEDFVKNLQFWMEVNYIKYMFAAMEVWYKKYFIQHKPLNLKQINIQQQKHPIENIAKPYYGKMELPTEHIYWQNMLLWGALKICDHHGSAKISRIYLLGSEQFLFLDRLQNKLQVAGSDFYTHQKKCFEQDGNVILVAPTGSGKTEAAMGWLKNQILKRQGRAFYILPYTASINAMHKRLVNAISQKETIVQSGFVGIQHGKLLQYLASLFEDTTTTVLQNIKKNKKIRRLRDQQRKLIYPLKVVTPFQILKYFYGVKGFEMGFTELAGSYLIFDEIHAYDSVTFAQILVSLRYLIRYLDCRVLIMTATLPSFMLNELKSVLNVKEVIYADKQFLENYSRHKVSIIDGSIFEQLERINRYLRLGKRVIVTCNTVKNAQNIYKAITDNSVIDAKEITLLHSRFNANDRNRKEKGAFKENTRILVGTQAIEVSLDIDYDVIFSEPAPLDALLQRFGRINRKRQKGICPVYVCRVGGEYDSFIYPQKVIERTINALESIDVIQEIVVQELLDKVYPDWEEHQATYENTFRGFEQSIYALQPFTAHKENEEEFYDKFDGVQVLPSCFIKIYKQLVSQYNFIEAQKYFVTIRQGLYQKLKNENLIYTDTFTFERLDGQHITDKIIVARCKYSSELGLTDEPEYLNWVEDQFF